MQDNDASRPAIRVRCNIHVFISGEIISHSTECLAEVERGFFSTSNLSPRVIWVSVWKGCHWISPIPGWTLVWGAKSEDEGWFRRTAWPPGRLWSCGVMR